MMLMLMIETSSSLQERRRRQLREKEALLKSPNATPKGSRRSSKVSGTIRQSVISKSAVTGTNQASPKTV